MIIASDLARERFMTPVRVGRTACAILIYFAVREVHASIDQAFVPLAANAALSVGPSSEWAQTFTVGISGRLTGFDLWVTRYPGVVEPLLFDIRTTSAGAPSEATTGANILVSGAEPAASFDGPPSGLNTPAMLTHIDLGGGAPLVSAGDVLAISLGSEDPNARVYSLFATNAYDYVGGESYSRSPGIGGGQAWTAREYDVLFRTYVTPIPEASGMALAVLAACGLPMLRAAVR
jgi:hypothetical protein